MEWALCIPQSCYLHRIADPWRETGERNWPDARRVIENMFGGIKFTRLYFGQEFCEKALPAAGELLESVEESKRLGMEFTLVTPYVTERGLAKLEGRLKELERERPGCEVVVNDWGVLYLLHRKFPTLNPVLGRLLNKIWRDPRLDNYLKNHPAGDCKILRNCSLAGPYMKKLLKRLNVKRIELDNLLQGLDDGLSHWGYKLSLYIPYGCITTGRICLFGSWGLKQPGKFRSTGRTCSRQCRHYRLEMRDMSGQVPKNGGWRIVQKGNTVFYEQTADLLAKGLEQAGKLKISRIVYQPDPL
ncbi:MAG: hypothetical protein ACOY40_11775 [Bacillota bacterium]